MFRREVNPQSPLIHGQKELSRRTLRLTASLFALTVCLSVTRVGASDVSLNNPLKTTSGLLSGDPQLENGVRVFRGIPFAAPPVGNLRWRAPQPSQKWSGVREARSFSAECTQLPSTDPLYALYYSQEQPRSEDCLYLNVWTPAHSSQDRLAVLVWIYGGGFRLGSGSQPVYNPVNLAKRVGTSTFGAVNWGFRWPRPSLRNEVDSLSDSAGIPGVRCGQYRPHTISVPSSQIPGK